MRFNLTLIANGYAPELTLNYQYPLSAAIYKIIQRADASFATFLHNTGYGNGYKSFKLFTFSDIRTPFRIAGDRMQMQSNKAELTVCFHVPEAAENFIKGLFTHQHLEIADQKSKVSFQVQQVESIRNDVTTGDIMNVLLQPLSPLMVGRKNENGNYDYRSPLDPDFIDCLLYNWLEKYVAAYPADENRLAELREKMKIEVLLFPNPPQKRVIAIKQGTHAETKIRGYTRFRLKVSAPKEMVELAMNAGLGLHNGQGCGCMEAV